MLFCRPRVYRDPKGKITCVALYACNPQGIYFGPNATIRVEHPDEKERMRIAETIAAAFPGA